MKGKISLLLTPLVAGAALVWQFQRDALYEYLSSFRGIEDLPAMMSSNWLVFAIAQTVASASGVLPASVIAMMAGAALGFAPGLALSITSTMFGGWLAFKVSRSALRNRISRWLEDNPAMARLDDAMNSEGWLMVALLRISPVMPFALTSYGLGLTRISQRDFLLGTLASLPALTGYVAIGAIGRHGLLIRGDPLAHSHLTMLAVGTAIVLYTLLRVRNSLERTIAPPQP